MSLLVSTVKPSDTATFAGYPSYPEEATNGRTQIGGFASAPFGSPSDSVLEAKPAAVKVTISGTGVVRVGAPNQFKATVSLQAGTLALTGHISDAQNTNTDPAIDSFTWYSRQRFVATVNSAGLVTLVGTGSTTIECRNDRGVNAAFAGATQSGFEFVYATLDLQVTP